jgi:hypothetical protein
MTEERRLQHKLSLARAFRRMAAKFRRGESSADYQRWERAEENSDEAGALRELMRDEGRGRWL